MIDDLVGHIESFPLRLALGVLTLMGMAAIFGAGLGVVFGAFVLVLRLFGVELK